MRSIKIEQLWIIPKNGTCTINRYYKHNGCHSSLHAGQKTAGYITAIQVAAKYAFGDKISVIRMKNKSLYYLGKDSHILVALSDNENREKKVQKVLNKVNTIIENCCNMLDINYVNASRKNIKKCGKMVDSYLGYSAYAVSIERYNGEGISAQKSEIHRSLERFFSTFEHFNMWKQIVVT
jgi:hypothetical protein